MIPHPHPSTPPIATTYTPGSAYDEMCDTAGEIRPHWQAFMRSLDALGVETLEKSRQEARRIFHENGVSYNVHGDPHGHQRTWELDPVPLIISSGDWSDIEMGITQRTELLNLVLQDLYGPRQLLHDGLLPPELVFGHDGFLLACDQFGQPSGMHLIDYAVDLARGPDGRMWVLRDYTQAPSGIGYALENRTVMTRVLPRFFQDGMIHRMSFFFRTIRAALNALPIRRRDHPRIVVLTPGPYSELYFEHAYLATYLGYPLVMGDDLTVREGCVWLKTLGGLQPVDVIIRRVTDRFCDPLELAEDSLLGVTGLLQAARMGNVIVVNPIGSSVLENPGLIPFLPSIARHFFGHDLKLPSAATWWCGQEKERNYVLENLHRMVIKPIHRSYNVRSVFGALLSKAECDALRMKILAYPHLYVGQEQVSFSTTPCLIKGTLEPRHAAIRMFATEHEGRYRVMKGGLAHASRDPGISAPSRHFNTISKDTWIMADKPERHVSLWLQSPGGEQLEERSGILASRAAENLFWTGRYAERTEGTARLLRVVINHLGSIEERGDTINRQLIEVLLATFHGVTGIESILDQDETSDTAAIFADVRASMTDSKRMGSIAQLLLMLNQATYMVRDRWSFDNWRVLDGIRNHWRNVQGHINSSLFSAGYELEELITSLAAFMGLNMESMTREPGWLMLDTGRRIERALWLIRMVKSMLIEDREEVLQHMVLESFLATHESLITHRRRYRSYLQVQTVLQVVLLDETNPRALAYQVERIQRNLKLLPRKRTERKLGTEERLILEAVTRIKLADAQDLARSAAGMSHTNLLDFAFFIEEKLLAASQALSQVYFSHAPGAQQLAPTQRRIDPA